MELLHRLEMRLEFLAPWLVHSWPQETTTHLSCQTEMSQVFGRPESYTHLRCWQGLANGATQKGH